MKLNEIVWMLIVSLLFGICMAVLLHYTEPLLAPPAFDISR